MSLTLGTINSPDRIRPARMPDSVQPDPPTIPARSASILDWFKIGDSAQDNAKQGADNLRPVNRSVRTDPDVRRAAASVVRVETDRGLGTGWVAAPELVVTNAHVLANSTRTQIRARGESRKRRGKVVYFNARQDVAVIRVPGLRAKPLRFDPRPDPGESGAALGYPLGGPYRARSVRLGGTRTVKVRDAFGRPVKRRADELRGKLEPGNSGGPVLNAQGQVISTVFAKKQRGIHGGWGVPNDVVRRALDAPRHRVTAREMRASPAR